LCTICSGYHSAYVSLNLWDLALTSVLVLTGAGLSILLRLNIHRSLLIAAPRMAVRLAYAHGNANCEDWPTSMASPSSPAWKAYEGERMAYIS
jgi:hypothetical protein